MTNNNNDNNEGDENQQSNNNKIVSAVIVCLLCSGLIGLLIWFFTRPSNLDIVNASTIESLPSLIKVATLLSSSLSDSSSSSSSSTNDNYNGAVVIEYTTLLEDPSVIYYYVNVKEIDFEALIAGNDNNNDNQSLELILTRPSSPTSIETLGNDPIFIQNVTQPQQFPYRLIDGNDSTSSSSSSFVPGDYNGVVFAFRDKTNNDELLWVAVASFTIIVDASLNVATPTIAPTMAPTKTAQPTTTTNNSSSTNNPTQSPAASMPTTTNNNPLPPVLISELESIDYNIGGTITINYRADFINGQVQMLPFLRFELPAIPNAPGPYLYLSKRSYSSTRDGDIFDNDILVLIDLSPDKGSYTVRGTFEQSLDEVMNVNDIFDYTNGSWIVWCRPFTVWLGGGPISPVS